jgi:hypothetical protein
MSGMSGKIAAAVGVVVILGGVFAGVRLISGDHGGPAPTPPDNGPVQPIQPSPQPSQPSEPSPSPSGVEPSPVEPTPNGNGSLADELPSTVGDWSLTGAEAAPDFAQNLGASDAVIGHYGTSGGSTLDFNLLAYSSQDDSLAGLVTLANGLINNGLKQKDQFTITGSDGSEIGQGYVLQTSDDQVVVFNANSELAALESAPGSATDFFDALFGN